MKNLITGITWYYHQIHQMLVQIHLCFTAVFLAFCLHAGLMEHTKRLLRAFFELSQTHRGELL